MSDAQIHEEVLCNMRMNNAPLTMFVMYEIGCVIRDTEYSSEVLGVFCNSILSECNQELMVFTKGKY